MSDFNPSPYRGDGNIGHVSEDLFKMYFVGSNVSTRSESVSLRAANLLGPSHMRSELICGWLQLALLMASLPGNVLGSELRPRKYK